MPTANCNTGNGFVGVLSYIHQVNKDLSAELKHEVLEYNNISGTVREMAFQMREIANERDSVKKPVLHLQINFHPDEKLNSEDTLKVVDDILKDIGVEKDNHQYCIISHRDKAHSHSHVAINRVAFDGTLLNDHRIKDRLQVACDKVEKLKGLHQTQNRTVVYDSKNEKGYSYTCSNKNRIKEPKIEKNQRVNETEAKTKRCVISALELAKTPLELKQKLEDQSIEINFLTNEKGIYGVSFKCDRYAFKGSKIGLKWGEIDSALIKNQLKAKEKINMEREPKKLEEKVVPTVDEQKEIELVKKYNIAISSILREYNDEVKKENVTANLDSIFEKNGFKYDSGVYYIENDSKRLVAPFQEIQNAQKDIIKQYNNHFDRTLLYDALMEEKPQKIEFWDSSKVKDEKKFSNQELKFNQESIKKPQFIANINTNVERYNIKSSFEVKADELWFKASLQRVKAMKLENELDDRKDPSSHKQKIRLR